MDLIKKFFNNDEENYSANTTSEEYYSIKTEDTLDESGKSRMILLEPRAYSESYQIIDHLKSRNPVVVNLKRVTATQAKRIMDVLNGAAYAIGGDIQIAAQGWEDTDTITVDENTQVELNAQAAEGYEFDGWYEGQTLLSQQETYTAAVDTNQTIVAQFQQLTRLRDLGPEGNTNEAGNVYNILDNTMLGYWSVSIKTTRLPEEFQGASEWKIIVLGEEYTFSPNFLVADIYETNVEDTITEDIEDIRNAFFVAVF